MRGHTFRQDDHHQPAGHDHHLVALEYERHVHQADRGHLLDALNGPHVGLILDHHTALKDGDNFSERVKVDREKGKKKRNIFGLREEGKGRRRKESKFCAEAQCLSKIYVLGCCFSFQ